jgi:hypothetical protein
MRSKKVLGMMVLAVGLACHSVTELHGPSGSIALSIVPNASSSAALDAGKIYLRGPMTQDLTATPGQTTTVPNLPPGSYTVSLEGLNAGLVTLFGETTVNVVAGQTSTAFVSLSTFIPAITNLPASSTGTLTMTVGYSSVTNAASYKIEAASDPAFTADKVTQTSTATQASLTVPRYATYYVRVSAIDAFQGNGRPSAVSTTAMNPPPADLLVTSGLTVTPTVTTPGTDVTLSGFTITNQGGAATNSQIRVGYYLSSDATITTSDTRFGAITLAGLSAGGSIVVSAQAVTIPITTPLGNYFIGVLVDETNLTAESSEANNFKSTPLSVVAGPPIIRTDPASSITSTSATMQGTIFQDGRAYSIWFEFGTSSTLATFGTSTPATGPNANCPGTSICVWTTGLINLTTGTTYYYRFVGSNAVGTVRGPIVSFRAP